MVHLIPHPMSGGDLLDEAIRLYGHNCIPFAGVVAVVRVPILLLNEPVPLMACIGTPPLRMGSR